MSNIFTHNRLPLRYHVNKSEYWDFHLWQNAAPGISNVLDVECLSTFIDTNDPECHIGEKLASKSGCEWPEGVNKGIVLENIGLTGVDNGTITFDKDRITNEEFLKLYTESKLEIEPDDLRLKVTPVSGNNGLFCYDTEIVEEDGMTVSKLDGGFYQGFFQAGDGCEYKVLPNEIGSGWCMEMTLKRQDFESGCAKPKMSEKNPDAAGTFLYIGTRAEDKWWKYYDVETEFECMVEEGEKDGFVTEECDSTRYFIPMPEEEDECIDKDVIDYTDEGGTECPEWHWTYPDALYTYNDNQVLHSTGGFVWLQNELQTSPRMQCGGKKRKNCCICDKILEKDCSMYVEDDYFVVDKEIDENTVITTKNGNDVKQPNIVEIRTDNKFLIFDRTCNGKTVMDWEEGTEIVLTDVRIKDEENYFLLFDRTCNGKTVRDFDRFSQPEARKYDVLKDIYRNALSFKANDDGSISYRYLVRDCDSEEEAYRIESENTKPGLIQDGKWFTVAIRIKPSVYNRSTKYNSEIIQADDTMRIMMYFNGRLVLVSKPLPLLKLKKLDEPYDKQEGVPFNISIGGGTQGLCDVVYQNYMDIPQCILPLEREFGGTFTGFFKSFRFYTCDKDFTKIQGNYLYEKDFSG